MNEASIAAVIISSLGVLFTAMWAMFRSLQQTFLKHLENSDLRMIELITTKNGHMERIAEKFNNTVQDFQGTVSTLVEKVSSIDERV